MAEVFKLGIAANNNQPIKEVNTIEVLANKGIVGDRHFHDFNDPYNQLSLIEAENIDDAVNMMQRQKQWNDVVFAPLPGIDQCGNLRLYGLVGADNALGFVGGAAGKQHHGTPGFIDLRQCLDTIG